MNFGRKQRSGSDNLQITVTMLFQLLGYRCSAANANGDVDADCALPLAGQTKDLSEKLARLV